MPISAVETDGVGTRVLNPATLRQRRTAQRQPDLPAAFDARIKPLLQGLARIDLCEQVKRLEGMIARVLGADIQLDLDVDLAQSATRAEDEARVRIDPARLERVLLNLASNARAALEGSPAPARFRISTSRVSIDRNGREAGDPQSAPIAGLREGEHLRLTAGDNGCGMAPALIDQIFEPFFTTRGKNGGTGLGLATIAEVVRESRGGIRVESAPEEGTAFHLYFPIAAPAAPPRLDSSAARV